MKISRGKITCVIIFLTFAIMSYTGPFLPFGHSNSYDAGYSVLELLIYGLLNGLFWAGVLSLVWYGIKLLWSNCKYRERMAGETVVMQQKWIDNQQKISDDLSELKNRVISIEKMLREIE